MFTVTYKEDKNQTKPHQTKKTDYVSFYNNWVKFWKESNIPYYLKANPLQFFLSLIKVYRKISQNEEMSSTMYVLIPDEVAKDINTKETLSIILWCVQEAFSLQLPGSISKAPYN